MDEVRGIQVAHDDLQTATGNWQSPPPEPLEVSDWIAMSAMQKAVRRGRTELALRAAATLLNRSPERFWRRTACIAFEDVGLGDLDLVAITTAAMAGKRARACVGGEWVVASYLICKMAPAIKCRGADDLLLVAENHPAFETHRLQLGFSRIEELLRIVTSNEPIPMKALAAWFALGTNRRPSPRLARRQGDPIQLFAALRELLGPELAEIAQEGHRRSGEVLPIFMALLAPHLHGETASMQDDQMPAETMVGPVPGFCVDLYTRPGRAALARLIDGSTETARWVQAHIPPLQRITFLGTIYFRLEGQCTKGRLRWPVADQLQRATDFDCNGPHCGDATEILQLARSDLGELNDIRAQVYRSIDHV
ncbi:hypothetical protein ACRQ5Q_39385 [Bradyrhizobium sp. PMVTL-01]|uniref:hypothetical protein n=1 Tax=Bradyrhizobium sp. PMVTL-01 TaxID=3434999 RepID=UPI003F704AC8